MKDILHIKHRKLAQDEARVITINKDAIQELLLENLVEHQSDYFDTEESEDDNIYIMSWDYDENILTYVAMPMKYCTDGCKLDFEHIRKKLGITTKSLFTTNRYRTLILTKDCFKKD